PDEPALDDVERAVDVLALLEDDLAGLEDLQRHVPDEVAALGLGESVEGGGTLEEAGEAVGDRGGGHRVRGWGRGGGKTRQQETGSARFAATGSGWRMEDRRGGRPGSRRRPRSALRRRCTRRAA